MDTEMHLRPTVVPDIDLTNVWDGLREVDAHQMTLRGAADVAARLNEQKSPPAPEQPKSVDNSRHYEITQNISSPEALNEAQIYRNTRNLVARLAD